MIQVNDRTDPQQGWVNVDGAAEADAPQPDKRAFTAPSGTEFTARLSNAGATSNRFSISITDDIEPTWFGVVESWQPAGSAVLVVCRPARNVQETVGMPIPTGSGGPTAAGTGGVGI